MSTQIKKNIIPMVGVGIGSSKIRTVPISKTKVLQYRAVMLDICKMLSL